MRRKCRRCHRDRNPLGSCLLSRRISTAHSDTHTYTQTYKKKTTMHTIVHAHTIMCTLSHIQNLDTKSRNAHAARYNVHAHTRAHMHTHHWMMMFGWLYVLYTATPVWANMQAVLELREALNRAWSWGVGRESQENKSNSEGKNYREDIFADVYLRKPSGWEKQFRNISKLIKRQQFISV